MAEHIINEESIHIAGVFADISALKAIDTSSLPHNIWAYVEAIGTGEYYLDQTSSATETSPDVISPTTGTGRWIKKVGTLVSDYNLVKHISLAGSGSFLPLAGGTLTGPLVLSAEPTTSLEPATKSYVDNFITATQTLTNKTLTSPKINVGSDATGDLYYRDASGNFTRLAVGTSNQVLKGGTTPSYASISTALGYTPLNVNGDTMTGLLLLSGDPVSASGAATKNYVDTRLTGVGIPIGSSIEYGGTTDLNPDPDSGAVFFIEDGRAISRTTYATLFSRIGTAFGAGNGTTTFNIPNSAGRTVVAYDTSSDFNAVGKTGGSKTYTLLANNLPVSPPWTLTDPGHSHNVRGNNNTNAGTSGVRLGDTTGSINASPGTNNVGTGITVNNNSGGGQSFSLLKPYIVKNKLIRVL